MRPLPEWVRDSARSLLGLVDRNTPLADLTFDSLLDDADGADPAAPRRLLFVSGTGVQIAVSLHGSSPVLVAALEITPPRQYDIVVQQKSFPDVTAATDVNGVATIQGLNSGLTALHISPHGTNDQNGCRTAWVVY